jgi:preprotein translocase SecE subunit
VFVSKKASPKTTGAKEKTVKTRRIKLPRWLRLFGGYFKGAWQELRQVRWPNNRATWGLTLAVIVFSIFFAAVILGLDALFQYLFKEILL